MKRLKKLIIGGILLVVVGTGLVVYIVSANLGLIAKHGIEKFAPMVTGTGVSVEKIDFSIWSGTLHVKNFIIRNPEKYNSDYAFKLESFDAGVKLKSLMTNKITVTKIIVDGMKVNYEQGITGCNLYDIKKNIDSFTAKDKPAEKEKAPAGKPGEGEKPGKAKKFEIYKIDFRNGNVAVLTQLSGNIKAEAPLPRISMKNLGTENPEGASVAEIAPEVFAAVIKAVVSAVKVASVNINGKTLDSLDRDDMIKQSEEIIKGVKGLFK
jgi:hypothetical protein